MSDKPDVGKDLRAVGGFFRKLVGFTERAERVVHEATRSGDASAPAPKMARKAETQTIDVRPTGECEVCGGTRIVGETRKIACPACTSQIAR